MKDQEEQYSTTEGAKGLTRRRLMVAAGATAAAATVGLPGISAGAATTRTAPRKSTQKYYWVAANIADPFYVDGITGMKAFGQAYGVQTEIVGPSSSNLAGMVTAFEETLAKPDCAGIFSYFYFDFNAVASLYKKAYQMGIPVVNGASDWGGPRLAWCGLVEDSVGAQAAQFLAQAGITGQVGFIGNNGVNLLRDAKIFGTSVKQYPHMQYVGNAIHNGSGQDALKQYSAFLTAHPNVTAMFFGDGLGPSIVDGLVAAAPNVKLLLRGFGKSGLQAVKAGKVLGTLDRSTWAEEFWGFIPLYHAVNGGWRAPDGIQLPLVVVTKKNVDVFMANPYKIDGVHYH